MSNKKTISQRRVGDYLIPNLILPHEEANLTLGKWGMLHKDFLFKKQEGVIYNTTYPRKTISALCGDRKAGQADV